MRRREKPWHGVLVATPTFYREDLSVDFDCYAEHVRWLAENGCHGVCPNGSLGEYQVLTPDERAAMVRTAVENAPDDFSVMAGVGAYGAREARAWAEQAAEAGAHVVLALPPNSYRADDRSVVEHYREIAKAGLPVSAYNNPLDTKVDLRPELLAELYREGLIVGVKEFTGEPRRCYQIAELVPELDILIGTDDSVVEVGLAGATGWISGYASVFPQSCVSLYEATLAHDVDAALAIYRPLHPLLRWDFHTEFVQAIKLSMDVIGRYGGPVRPPRQPMVPADEQAVRTLTTQAAARFA